MQDAPDPMAQTSFPIIELIAGAIGGGGLTKLADMFLSKDSRQIKAMKDVVESLSDQLKRTDERLKGFETRLHDAEATVAECEGKHHDCEHNVARLQSEIDRLKRRQA